MRVIGWVNPHAAGYRAPANIQIAVEPPQMIPEVVEHITALPEVSFAAALTGEYDIFADVRCRDMEHLNALIAEKIHPLKGGLETLFFEDSTN